MRIPPQNIEAEQSLIASILVSEKILDDCSLKPDDFYQTKHQKIYRTFLDLKAKDENIDLVSVGQCLIDDKDLVTYVAGITDTATITLKAKTTAKIIKAARVKRDLIVSLQTIQDRVDESSLETLLDFAQSEIMKYTVSKHDNKIFHIRDLLMDHVDKIEKANTQKQEKLIQTGFRCLDQRLNLDGPNYVVIAGRPSMGKTAFALSIIKNMATNNQRPAILSLEMGKSKLVDRWLSMMTGINSMNFYKYRALSSQQWQQLQDSVSFIYDKWDALISDAPANSIDGLERQARRMKSQGATAIFIDQLSQIGGGSDDDFKNYTQHSNRIARLKKELGIPIFLLAQLNRKLEDRSDKEPRLSDLKMTGSLEEDSDVAILLYRPEYYEKTPEKKAEKARDVVVNIAKNRDGATHRESDVIVFEKAQTLFEEDFSRVNNF